MEAVRKSLLIVEFFIYWLNFPGIHVCPTTENVPFESNITLAKKHLLCVLVYTNDHSIGSKNQDTCHAFSPTTFIFSLYLEVSTIVRPLWVSFFLPERKETTASISCYADRWISRQRTFFFVLSESYGTFLEFFHRTIHFFLWCRCLQKETYIFTFLTYY